MEFIVGSTERNVRGQKRKKNTKTSSFVIVLAAGRLFHIRFDFYFTFISAETHTITHVGEEIAIFPSRLALDDELCASKHYQFRKK